MNHRIALRACLALALAAGAFQTLSAQPSSPRNFDREIEDALRAAKTAAGFDFQTYIDSQRHMARQAARTGATSILSNHSEFDNAVNKNRMLAGRGNGPHPYVGAEGVQRYFQVLEHCARAAQLRLEQQAARLRGAAATVGKHHLRGAAATAGKPDSAGRP